jgi:gliding motility-associated lipoprotein GldD
MIREIKVIALLSLVVLMFSCKEEETWIPKPTGYMKRSFPKRNYITYQDSMCPYTFEIVDYANVLSVNGGGGCHKDIEFMNFNCELNLSYLPVESNLFGLTEYVQTKIKEHTSIAKGITPVKYIDKDREMYGMYYRLDGDVALNGIFFLTDSTNHFLSGKLTFNVAPNYDSLKPSIDYVTEDIQHMLESVHWINK